MIDVNTIKIACKYEALYITFRGLCKKRTAVICNVFVKAQFSFIFEFLACFRS